VRRTRLPGLLGTLVLLVAVSGVTLLRLSKEVRLVVDGAARTVPTLSSDVGGLLEQEGIAVDQHDVVSPGLAASLAEGMEVRVLLAKEITVLVDDVERTVHVTGDTTVEDVLKQVNVRISRHGVLEPSRGARVEDGDVIVYDPAVSVKLAADGRIRDVVTNADDVGSLLTSLGIELRDEDRVEPRTRTDLRQGLRVDVIRVTRREVAVQQPIGFTTQVRTSNELMLGVRRVERAGVPGALRRVYEVTFENDKEVARTLLRTETVRRPVSQVIVEGTRPPHTQSGVASWYHRSGMVAAHKTLPFGTQVKVTNTANGRSVVVVINDRGPYVAGRIIDLSDDAFAQLAALGSGTINVRIAW
jgi:resuscitation-promoting factor RpfB